MSIAVAVKHMLAAGMSAEDIVTAVAEMEAAQQPLPDHVPNWRLNKRERENKKYALAKLAKIGENVNFVDELANNPAPPCSPPSPSPTPPTPTPPIIPPTPLSDAGETNFSEAKTAMRREKRDLEFQALQMWADLASRTKVAALRGVSEPRRRSLAARLDDGGLDRWREVLERVERSNFLQGANNQGFVASFDWVVKPANWIKILEGNYENGRGYQSSNGPQTQGNPAYVAGNGRAQPVREPSNGGGLLGAALQHFSERSDPEPDWPDKGLVIVAEGRFRQGA